VELEALVELEVLEALGLKAGLAVLELLAELEVLEA
jgi:hypothetical protein